MQGKQAVMYVDASVDEKAGKMAGAFLMLWQQKGGGSDQGGWVSHGGSDSMLGEALAVCQGLAHATRFWALEQRSPSSPTTNPWWI